MTTTVERLRAEAERLLGGVAEGEELAPLARTFIAVGVAVSVTSLDVEAFDGAVGEAMAAGATPAQVQEIVALVSGLGVHSLMMSAPRLIGRPEARRLATQPLTAEQQALWRDTVGDDPYWAPFEAEFPGFLDALLRLSPDSFRVFHDYCAVPWRSGLVSALVKELVAMACDASPTHRFAPGLRLHLRNALKLGAGRRAILAALDIAAAAPGHMGVD